jgi:hypothetical protein
MRKENKCCVVIFLVALLMVTGSCGFVGAGMAFIPTSVVKDSTVLDQEIFTTSLSSSVTSEKINILDFFNSFDRASCLADWRETSGSAEWQESSATVGQTIQMLNIIGLVIVMPVCIFMILRVTHMLRI